MRSTQPGQSLYSEGAILNPLSLLLLDLALPVANKLVLTSDRVYLYACITHEICFCAPEGRIAPIGASNRRRVLNRRRVSSSRNDDFIPKRLSYPESINLSNRKPVTVTNPIVLHRHLAARMRMVAPFLSNTLFSRCSISTRALAAGWLGAWLAGWLAGWLDVAPKCVKNAHP